MSQRQEVGWNSSFSENVVECAHDRKHHGRIGATPVMWKFVACILEWGDTRARVQFFREFLRKV